MKRFLSFAEHIGDRIKRIISDKRFKRYLPLGLVVLIALISFVTCVPRAEAPSDPPPETTPVETVPTTEPPTTLPQPTTEPTTEPSTEPPTEPVYEGPFNPLTGQPVEQDISKNRPLAIMINNIRAALPQVGISKADIIYEMLVEGGITRMLAIYQDVNDVGVIGSIRSARPYYVDVAQSFDAIFIFAGASEHAYSVLASRNITRLDGVHGRQTQIFYRDPGRQNMAFEHRLVSSGSRITEYLPTYNFRLEHEDGYVRALSFSEDGTPAGGEPALDFSIKFSSGKSTSFTYDADEERYYLRQYGNAYRDGNDNSQLSVTNVLVLQTSVSRIPGDRYDRLRVTTTGNGGGYFACGGKYIEIDWSRENDSAQFKYTLKDGSELVLGQGKTYICIVPNNLDQTIA